MAAVRLAPPFVAACVGLASACSIWAALDDPYKSPAAPGGESATDGGVEAEAGIVDAAINRVVEAGFAPWAIAAYGDTVYAVDDHVKVHVAYDAGTSFTLFTRGDGGDSFLLDTNGIAANADGVFWTVGSGVRHCAPDGRACGLIAGGSPGEIAAGDSVVAWLDDGGVRTCTTPIKACTPATIPGSANAMHIAAGPNGVVAWTDGQQTIHLVSADGTTALDAGPFGASLLATDWATDELYWLTEKGVGFAQFDGGGETAHQLSLDNPLVAFFASRGIVFYSLNGSAFVYHCHFDDAHVACSNPGELSNGLPQTTNRGIVANSRLVLAVATFNDSARAAVLLAWPVPH
jgi:hypothetical protein